MSSIETNRDVTQYFNDLAVAENIKKRMAIPTVWAPQEAARDYARRQKLVNLPLCSVYRTDVVKPDPKFIAHAFPRIAVGEASARQVAYTTVYSVALHATNLEDINTAAKGLHELLIDRYIVRNTTVPYYSFAAYIADYSVEGSTVKAYDTQFIYTLVVGVTVNYIQLLFDEVPTDLMRIVGLEVRVLEPLVLLG